MSLESKEQEQRQVSKGKLPRGRLLWVPVSPCQAQKVPLNSAVRSLFPSTPPPFQISNLERGLFLWRGTRPYGPFNSDVQRGRIPDPMYPHPCVNVKAITQMNPLPPPHHPNKKQTSNSPRH